MRARAACRLLALRRLPPACPPHSDPTRAELSSSLSIAARVHRHPPSINQQVRSIEEYQRVTGALYGDIVRPLVPHLAAPWAAPQAAEHDAQTFQTW